MPKKLQQNTLIYIIIMSTLLFVVCGMMSFTKNDKLNNENMVTHNMMIKTYHKQEKKMPAVADIIITDKSCHALCEDGTVWTWSREESMETAQKLQGLGGVVKIVNVGGLQETIYALTKVGYIYGWGKNEELLHLGEGYDSWKEWDWNYEEPVRIRELSKITELDGGKGKVFALDQNGTFYMWGLNMDREDINDTTPGFPEDERMWVEGIEVLVAGGGYYNYSYFLKKDGTVISIMVEDRTKLIGQYIFPIITEEWENADMTVRDSVSAQYLQEDSVTRLSSDRSKFEEVILYEAGKCGDIENIASDGYTVFCYLNDDSLWYWDSNRVRFHDDVQMLLRPEAKSEDYAGYWRKLDYGEVLEDNAEDENGIRIADTCSMKEHVLFLTEDGQVFVSEYVTEKTESVEYYRLSFNPYHPSEISSRLIDLKTVQLKKLELEHIKSINTDGDSNFSAVDEEGRCYYIDAETLIYDKLE